MESQNPRSLIMRKLLPGILGIGCVVGALFGLLNGYYWLVLSQIAFAAAMVLIFFGAEEKGGAFVYLTWTCLSVGILASAVAASI